MAITVLFASPNMCTIHELNTSLLHVLHIVHWLTLSFVSSELLDVKADSAPSSLVSEGSFCPFLFQFWSRHYLSFPSAVPKLIAWLYSSFTEAKLIWGKLETTIRSVHQIPGLLQKLSFLGKCLSWLFSGLPWATHPLLSGGPLCGHHHAKGMMFPELTMYSSLSHSAPEPGEDKRVWFYDRGLLRGASWDSMSEISWGEQPGILCQRSPERSSLGDA